MPSNYTVSLRFEMQGIGENLNTWGVRLNNALKRIDAAVAGMAPIALAGVDYTLSSSNTADDEARAAILNLTGIGGCAVIVPAVSKLYMVRNSTNGPVTITTGAGATVILAVGDAMMVFCDGVGVSPQLLGGLTFKAALDNLRAYVDAQAWGAQAGILPGQAGNAGGFLVTNGVTPSWRKLTVADIEDLATAFEDFTDTVTAQLAQARLDNTAIACAMAVAL